MGEAVTGMGGDRQMTPYYDEGGVTIYHADCVEVMPALGPVDLVVTSPPYNLGVSAGGGFGHYVDDAGMRERGGGGKWTGGALAHGYGEHDDAMAPDEYLEWQHRCVWEMWNTLGPAGAIFYNHKPRIQRGSLLMPTAFIPPELPIRQIVIWARAGGVNFAPTHYVPTHEWIVVVAREQFRLKSKGASGVGDVWSIPQESNTLHPAPFPLGLPSRIIETTGPRIVLDPFMGSGTTLRAAKSAGVLSVGIDNCEQYCEIAAKRLSADGASQEVFAL